jgi:hypothetical protein
VDDALSCVAQAADLIEIAEYQDSGGFLESRLSNTRSQTRIWPVYGRGSLVFDNLDRLASVRSLVLRNLDDGSIAWRRQIPAPGRLP